MQAPARASEVCVARNACCHGAAALDKRRRLRSYDLARTVPWDGCRRLGFGAALFVSGSDADDMAIFERQFGSVPKPIVLCNLARRVIEHADIAAGNFFANDHPHSLDGSASAFDLDIEDQLREDTRV